MPATITRTVYTYDELTEEAQENARDTCRHWNTDDDYWYEHSLDYWREELEKQGIYDAEISFSGFYHQGSGASFTGSVNLAEWMKAQGIARRYRALYYAATNPTNEVEAYATITRWRGYSHYTHGVPEVELRCYLDEDDPRAVMLNQQADAVNDAFEQWFRGLEGEIYRNLRDEYEYQTSDEVIAEMLITNETQFNEDGELYY